MHKNIITKDSRSEGILKEQLQDHNKRVVHAKKVKAKDGWKLENFNIVVQAFIETLTSAFIGDLDKGHRVDPRALTFTVNLPQIINPQLATQGLPCSIVGESQRANGQPAFEVAITMKNAAEFLKLAIPYFTGKSHEGDIWEMTSL